jgi:hypothetical protein
VSRHLRFLGLALAAVLLAAGLVACGRGESSTSRTDPSSSVEKGSNGQGQSGGEGENAASRSGSISEFRVSGGPKQEVNRIIAGSREASTGEREAASKALEESLEARADRDWSGQCETLSKKFVEVVEENGSPFAGVETNCAKSLAQAGEKAPAEALANNMSGPIAALRLVGGGQAFAFYHGVGGKEYLIPMEEESGVWKLDSLTAEEIPHAG